MSFSFFFSSLFNDNIIHIETFFQTKVQMMLRPLQLEKLSNFLHHNLEPTTLNGVLAINHNVACEPM
jgi:hypothetical protein